LRSKQVIIPFPWATFIAVCGFGTTILILLGRLIWWVRGVSDKVDTMAGKQTEHQAILDRHETLLQSGAIKFAKLERKCPLLTPEHDK